MNLENLNIVELNAQEKNEISGGDPFLLFVGLGLLIVAFGFIANRNRRINGPGGTGSVSSIYRGSLFTGMEL